MGSDSSRDESFEETISKASDIPDQTARLYPATNLVFTWFTGGACLLEVWVVRLAVDPSWSTEENRGHRRPLLLGRPFSDGGSLGLAH